MTEDLRARSRLESWKQEQFHVNVEKDKKKKQNPLDMNYSAREWKPTPTPGGWKSSCDNTQQSDSLTSLQLAISKERSRESQENTPGATGEK